MLLLATGSYFNLIEFAGTILAPDLVLSGVRSIGGMHSLGQSATLGAGAAGEVASDQSTSAFPRVRVRALSVGTSSFLNSVNVQS
jgi:hypothetical protein